MQEDHYNINDDSEDQEPDYVQDYGDRGQGQDYMQPDPRYRNGGYQQMQYSGGNQSNNYGRGQDRFGGVNVSGPRNEGMGQPGGHANGGRNRFMRDRRH